MFKNRPHFLEGLFGEFVGGVVASWSVCSTSDQVWLGSWRGHCVVFLGKTLYSHDASLHPGV